MSQKRALELTMAVFLLACLLLLAREAAQAIDSKSAVDRVIVVDAGHGGSDPGMVGIDGLEEKHINLAVARKLEEYLEEAGYQVVMTRKKDEGLYDEDAVNKKAQDLQRRCDLIEQYSPLLTISIHQNSYSDPSVNGPQVFYYCDSSEGESLAQIIQSRMNEQLKPRREREAKGNASYYLLKKSKGVLNIVECGFLTNPEEAKLLTQEAYQEKTARAIADGVLEYLEKSHNL